MNIWRKALKSLLKREDSILEAVRVMRSFSEWKDPDLCFRGEMWEWVGQKRLVREMISRAQLLLRLNVMSK